MSDREDELEPASGDEEMLADMVDRVACRLESGEPIDPGDDIPRHPAQASRLRSPLPTIRDLVDLGRRHAAPDSARRSEVKHQKIPSPSKDSRDDAPAFSVKESTPDA